MRDDLEERTADLIDAASEFVYGKALPTAERLRESADEAMERLGPKMEAARSRLDSELSDLPARAMKRLDAVPASTARRRSILAFLLGFTLGALFVYLFSPEKGAQRREAIKSKIAGEQTQASAADADGGQPTA